MFVDVVFAGFDWDAYNEGKISRKHGIPREEIESALSTRYRTMLDRAHSGAEERYVAVGKDLRGRPMLVIFTVRLRQGQALARPISARYMHNKELAGYENLKGR